VALQVGLLARRSVSDAAGHRPGEGRRERQDARGSHAPSQLRHLLTQRRNRKASRRNRKRSELGPHRAGPYRPVRLAQPGASGRSVRPGVWPTVFRTCPGGSLVLSVPLAEGVAGALVVLEQLRIHRASPIQRGASGTCGTQRDRWRRTRTRWRRCSGASVRHSHPWAWPPPRPQAAARPVNPADLTSAIRPYRRSPTHQVHSRTTRPACCRSPHPSGALQLHASGVLAVLPAAGPAPSMARAVPATMAITIRRFDTGSPFPVHLRRSRNNNCGPLSSGRRPWLAVPSLRDRHGRMKQRQRFAGPEYSCTAADAAVLDVQRQQALRAVRCWS